MQVHCLLVFSCDERTKQNRDLKFVGHRYYRLIIMDEIIGCEYTCDYIDLCWGWGFCCQVLGLSLSLKLNINDGFKKKTKSVD